MIMDSFFKGREKQAKVKILSSDGYGLAKEILHWKSPSRMESDSAEDKSVDHDMSDVKVEVVSENGRVERVIVHCSCGKRMELRCEY